MNENDDLEPYVTYFGGECKSLGNNRVGGRVVTFSGHHDPDLVKDFFDGSTDFWLNGAGERRPILYRHGVDGDVKRRRFGEAQLQKAADGIWATGYIAGTDDQSRKLLAMAEAGDLNWSSGSVGHLVAKSPVGASMHVDEWPIAELSLCPHDMVAEPRNILSLKSLPCDVPDFDSFMGYDHQEVLSRRAEAAVQGYYEQRAAEIYAQTLKWADEIHAGDDHQRELEHLARQIYVEGLIRQHDLRMQGLIT